LLRLNLNNLIGDDLGLEERKSNHYRNRIIFHDRKIDQCIHHVRIIAYRDAPREIFGRCKNHPPCFNFITYRDDFHAVSDADTCIGPREIVDPDLILVPVLNKGTPDFGNRPTFSFHRNNVAGRYLQVQHCFGVKPCLPATLITRISTINLQKYLRHHLKSHIHRDL